MFLSHFHFWGRGLTLVNPKLCSPSRAQGEFLDGSGQTAFVSNFRLHGGVGVLVLDAFFKKGDESKRGFFDGAKPRGKRAAAAGGGVEEEKGSAPPAAAEADHEDDEDDEDEDERRAAGKAGAPAEEHAADEGDNEIDQYAAQEAMTYRQLRGTAPFRDTQWCVSDERLLRPRRV
jgi:predicted phage gp36 major capsid-like protein